jgi:hypothetical protein
VRAGDAKWARYCRRITAGVIARSASPEISRSGARSGFAKFTFAGLAGSNIEAATSKYGRPVSGAMCSA